MAEIDEKLRQSVAKEVLKALQHVLGFDVYTEGHYEALSPGAKEPYLYIADILIPFIRQHIEPEIDKPQPEMSSNFLILENGQPDRLLTKEQLNDIFYSGKAKVTLNLPEQLPYLKDQDAKTASIKEEEIEAYRDRIASLVEEVTRLLDLSSHWIYHLK